MATLTSAIDARVERLRVTDPGSPRPGAYYRIDDELVELVRLARRSDLAVWYVHRGVEGTAATTHLAEAAITEFDVTAGGGAGLTYPIPLDVGGETVLMVGDAFFDEGTEGLAVAGRGSLHTGADAGDDQYAAALWINFGTAAVPDWWQLPVLVGTKARASWQPSTPYTYGTRIRVAEQVWVAQNDATSGLDEPTWVSTPAAYVSDGPLTWYYEGLNRYLAWEAIPPGLQSAVGQSLAANVAAIAHAGGAGNATLDDVKAVADKVDALIAALIASGQMAAP